MCELVAALPGKHDIPLSNGSVVDLPGGTDVVGFDDAGGVFVLQCWHPETDEWSTMLQPVEGMAWRLNPGSKIRLIEAKGAPAPAPSILEQVEAIV